MTTPSLCTASRIKPEALHGITSPRPQRLPAPPSSPTSQWRAAALKLNREQACVGNLTSEPALQQPAASAGMAAVHLAHEVFDEMPDYNS
ncbi:hypothetical protein BS78_K261600 [Paspalum vaginatum]|uniref:Uncharacterized protein n=1 Tax=Paspalum vaginatum TaxID=158149 RepID=A0A9W7XEA1_9POAL|nr:hypothetical protein BS78_K261600 [Paspalum vaginatum]